MSHSPVKLLFRALCTETDRHEIGHDRHNWQFGKDFGSWEIGEICCLNNDNRLEKLKQFPQMLESLDIGFPY